MRGADWAVTYASTTSRRALTTGDSPVDVTVGHLRELRSRVVVETAALREPLDALELPRRLARRVVDLVRGAVGRAGFEPPLLRRDGGPRGQPPTCGIPGSAPAGNWRVIRPDGELHHPRVLQARLTETAVAVGGPSERLSLHAELVLAVGQRAVDVVDRAPSTCRVSAFAGRCSRWRVGVRLERTALPFTFASASSLTDEPLPWSLHVVGVETDPVGGGAWARKIALREELVAREGRTRFTLDLTMWSSVSEITESPQRMRRTPFTAGWSGVPSASTRASPHAESATWSAPWCPDGDRRSRPVWSSASPILRAWWRSADGADGLAAHGVGAAPLPSVTLVGGPARCGRPSRWCAAGPR